VDKPNLQGGTKSPEANQNLRPELNTTLSARICTNYPMGQGQKRNENIRQQQRDKGILAKEKLPEFTQVNCLLEGGKAHKTAER
jgi:hypothetical protein